MSMSATTITRAMPHLGGGKEPECVTKSGTYSAVEVDQDDFHVDGTILVCTVCDQVWQARGDWWRPILATV